MSGRGDAQPFPPCPLCTSGKQLGAPSPDTPSWGRTGVRAAMLPCHTALGHGGALGMAGHRAGTGRRTMLGAEVCEAMVVPTRAVSCWWSSPPALSPAWPCPWRRAERARGSREAGIARGCRARLSFLLRTCAKACWGRRRGEEALAGFQLQARQPGSAGVAVPRVGPWAGHPAAGQGVSPPK